MTDSATSDQGKPTPGAPTTSTPEAPEIIAPVTADAPAESGDEPADGLLGEPKGELEEGQQGEAKPDAAEIVYELKAPDGFDFDDGYIERLTEAARAIGLSQDQAQGLIERDHAESVARNEAMQALLADTWKQYRDAIKADPVLGGPHFAETDALSTKAMRAHFPELEPILMEYPHLRHPALIKGLRNIGSRMGESSTFVSGTKAPSQLTPAEQWARDFPESPLPDSLRARAGA